MGYAVSGLYECVCVEVGLMTPEKSDILCFGWLKTMLFQQEGKKERASWIAVSEKSNIEDGDSKMFKETYS